MSTPAEWHPDDDLDAALRKQLRQIYRERFDITQDGAAAHTHDEVVADGGLRLWLRELARAETWLDQRTLFAVTGLPLPLAPMPACSAIWDFKRAARYRAEIMRDLHENASVICNDLLRHQQQARRLPLDVSLVFRLPAPIVMLFPVRDLLNATLPHICHLLQIAECDIYDPLPTKMDMGLSDAGLDVCVWLSDDAQMADAG